MMLVVAIMMMMVKWEIMNHENIQATSGRKNFQNDADYDDDDGDDDDDDDDDGDDDDDDDDDDVDDND